MKKDAVKQNGRRKNQMYALKTLMEERGLTLWLKPTSGKIAILI